MSSYRLIPYNYENELRGNESNYINQSGSFFYMRHENLKYAKIYVRTYISIDNLTVEFSKQNRIYDNQVSMVCFVP